MLIAEVARAGRGSFAYIDSDDVAMTAFARELGGWLAPYARAIEVRINGGPVESANELLFQSGRSVWLASRLHRSCRSTTGYERSKNSPTV